MQHFSKGGVLQFRDTQGFKMKGKKKGEEKQKWKEVILSVRSGNTTRYTLFFFIEVEECSSSQEQNGHTSLQN